MHDYYRRHKGFEGKIYRVHVPAWDLRGLITVIVISAAAISAVLAAAAFLWGLSLRVTG